MEDFSVPAMSDNSAYNSNTNVSTHQHKAHSLTPDTGPNAQYIYEMPSKSNAPTLKSDYAAFANCIQQSALLDRAADLDGASLSSLCDLKFSSPSPLSVPSNNDQSYKNVPHISGMENNQLLMMKAPATVAVTNNASDLNSEPGPSFTNLLFANERNNMDHHKVIQSCVGQPPPQQHQQQQQQQHPSHYLTLKLTENDSNYIQSSTAAGVLSAPNCEPNLLARNQPVIHNFVPGNTNNGSAENQITTTTTTSTISTTANNNKTSANNIIKNNNTSNITATQSALHNVEELAASACSSTPVNASAANGSTNEIPQEDANAQLQHNSSNFSSEFDSTSESDEFIDMETGEGSGYQDNTSSHSQQSAGGAPNSASSSANAAALLNGVGGGNGNAVGSGYMSLLPPVVGAASSSGHLGGGVVVGGGGTSVTAVASGESIDFKHLFEELCPVCGDKVSGYHYGLLTCESCKGFFKRTVQNKKVYTCVAERSCHIDKTQRKRCPYCRFQKCLEVGMKLEAVRADRMRGGRNKFGPMYKRDRARKLQVMRQRQLALQALRTSIGSADMKPTPLSPGYQQAYSNMNIKQEIQIPQISSLTQSPDSSPSPIAIALGQVNASTGGVITAPMNGNSGAGGGINNSSNGNTTSDGINRGGNGSCQEAGNGSLQNATESKLCFDSSTHPSSTADSIIEPLRVSPMIRDFVQSIDDREWQTQLFALLQKQTYNQVEVDLFELMCKVLDQNLFSQVDWARNTVFFKDLKVDDQMKLLQHSWSDMLVLDHLHHRIHNGLPDETQLNNGQVFNLLNLGLLGVPQLADYFNELQNKLQDLKFDMGDYVCMKFLILLNPDVRGIVFKKTVLEGHENVQAALLDYTLTCYPSVTDKFRRLLNILPDIHAMAARGEEHLYSKHCAGSAPTQTLLMEMLHAKRKV